jgi:hypothetical protein
MGSGDCRLSSEDNGIQIKHDIHQVISHAVSTELATNSLFQIDKVGYSLIFRQQSVQVRTSGAKDQAR